MPDALSPLLQPLPSAAAMRAADAAAIAAGLDGFTLMETAGRAAARAIRRAFPAARRAGALVLCGKGGNGGDGFVVARALAEAGWDVDVIRTADAPVPDAARHLAVLTALADRLPGRVRIGPFDGLRGLAARRAPGLIVDALLGTGRAGALRDPLGDLVRWANAHDAPRVALDVPTGLDADTGAVPDAAVRAALTVTFGAAKPGLFLGEGPAHAGRVVVAEIGLPRGLLDARIEAEGGAWRSTEAWARAVLPRRAADANKYTAGLALVVAGSPAFTGAPVLAAQAAARAGAGYVRLAAPEPAVPTLAAKLTEVALTPLPWGPDGLDARGTASALADLLPKAQSLLVGPGVGRDSGTARTVRAVLAAFDGPAVVDADGLAALDPDWLAAHARGRLVLTPHTGELKRLAGDDVDLDDRIGAARRLAAAWGVVLVLKGLPSVVATPEGAVFVGGPHATALATAGTGDVLAGLTAGFLAQGLAPPDAALLALHVGGRAAWAWAAGRAAAAMQASDLLALVPRVLHALGG